MNSVRVNNWILGLQSAGRGDNVTIIQERHEDVIWEISVCHYKYIYSPFSRPVAVFHRSRPWCLRICPGPIMSCFLKVCPLFSLVELRFSMRFHTSCNLWCRSYSLTLKFTAAITSRIWARALERSAHSSVSSEKQGRTNTEKTEGSCCVLDEHLQMKYHEEYFPQQVAADHLPWVYCRILSSSTGYFVILWVTSKMHSGISLRRTKELLPCCLKNKHKRLC